MLLFLMFFIQLQQTAFFYTDPLEKIRDYRTLKDKHRDRKYVYH